MRKGKKIYYLQPSWAAEDQKKHVKNTLGYEQKEKKELEQQEWKDMTIK